MPGVGRPPKLASERINRMPPQRGEWTATAGIGWQHGEIPAPPPRLLAASRNAWDVWFRSWFAAHWTPDDLPGLTILVHLYDDVERAFRQPFVAALSGTLVRRPSPVTELRQMLDNYGVTPKGQQDRRWQRPKDEGAEVAPPASERYGHLRALGT